MDNEQEKLVYILYKKGKDNLSDFDKLIIAANPEIKKELTRLFSVDRDFCEKCDNAIEEAFSAMKKSEAQKKKRSKKILPLLAVPASLAACLLLVFMQIFNSGSRHVPLGGKVSIFLSPLATPGHFYGNGSSVSPGTDLQLSFQPPADAEKVRQAIIFSVNSRSESHVYYRYDGDAAGFDQRTRTVIREKIRLDNDIEYTGFLAFFSETSFNDQELINKTTNVVHARKTGAGKELAKKYKNDSLDYLFIFVREP